MKSIISTVKIKKSLILFIVFLFGLQGFAQEKKFQAATVGFYNLENLFDIYESAGYIDGTLDPQDELYHTSVRVEDIAKLDTVDCKCRLTEENIKGKKIIRSLILQQEFTPYGPKAWDSIKYNQKLNNLSTVIAEMGSDITGTAPVAVGVCEVENREVVEDLIAQPALAKYNYGVVHYNSLDKRGIDNALIYQKDRMTVTKTHKYELEVYKPNGNRDYTRDIIRVDALLDGEPIHLL
ncbi:MAG: endonuclease, partial [Weeksellaceae bacterium]